MQIKRFEAPDVTAALNLVKQAFGADAVILSVRNLKRDGSLRGLLGKSGVEVTAAIDPQKREAAAGATVGRLPVAAGATVIRAAAGGAYAGARPFSLGTDPIPQRKVPAMASSSGSPQAMREALARLRRSMTSHGVRDSLITEWLRRLPASLATDTPPGDAGLIAPLAALIEAKGICAPVTLRPGAVPRVIALVGPTGVGKTTAAARIAAQHAERLDGRIGLISCDDRKIGADGEIARYGRIIGVPVAWAWNPAAMRSAMEQMADRSVVIIDTPGISPGSAAALNGLGEMLEAAGAEIHLLLSAAARPGDLEKTIDRFSALDIQRLVMTRLDETEGLGALFNLPTARRIPLSWITFGPEIPEALRPAGGEALARLLVDAPKTIENWRSQAVWVVAAETAPAGAAPQVPGDRPAAPVAAAGYVANRNSDIFHVANCKWTRMIKAENMITFGSVEEAESQKFHACRTCCPGPGRRMPQRTAGAGRPA